MEPEAPKVPDDVAPARGLPPVAPPSGRFIVQLFLVPGLIVALAVLILLGFRYLVGGSHTADYFLKQLDSGNADIRWRGASDLAQVLKRSESVSLRSDAKFALDLAERLRAALDELNQAERATEERIQKLTAKDRDLAWRQFNDSKRPHVQFLAAALGDFMVPVGAPLLSEIALRSESPDVKGNTLQRRKAVWALGNLGENMKGFKALPAERQAQILKGLKEDAKGTQPRAIYARNALYYLENKTPSSMKAKLPSLNGFLASGLGPVQSLPFFFLRPEVPPGVVEVDRVLAQCARAEDRFLRVQVALAINFWDGPLVEPTLLLLARDEGHGTLLSVPEME